MSVGASEVLVVSSVHTSRVDSQEYEGEEEDEDDGEWSEIQGPAASSGKACPSDREAKKVAARPAAKSRAKCAALTGQDAPFPIFGFLRSDDLVLNVAWEIHGRMVVFKSKQLTWGLRALWAHRGKWRRNRRWFANMFGREIASIWGNTGAARQYLSGQHGPGLFT